MTNMLEAIRNSRVFSWLAIFCQTIVCWWRQGWFYGLGQWLKKQYASSTVRKIWLWLGDGPCHVQQTCYARFMHWLRRIVEKIGCWLENSLLRKVFLGISRFWHWLCQYSAILRLISRLSLRQWLLVALGLYLPIEFIVRDTLNLGLLSSVWEEAFILLGFGFVLWRRALKQTNALNRETPVDAWLLLFWAVGFLLMSLVSLDLSVAFAGYRIVVEYTLWFFLAVRLIEEDKDFKILYVTFAAVIAILVFHGIYQYVIAVEIPDSWTTSTESAVRTRVFSITGSPNILGSMVVLMAPLWAAGIYYCRRTWVKVACFVMTCCCFMTLLFTFSRGAWLGMILTVVFFALFVDGRLIALMGAGMAAVLIFVPSITSRLTFLMTEEYAVASAAGGRAMRWELGRYLLSLGDPWLGFGLGRYGGAVAMQNQVLDVTEYITGYYYMDNYYLKTMVEMGYLGLLFFLLLLGALVFFGFRAILRSDKPFHDLPGDPLVRGIDNKRILAVGLLAGMLGVLVHCMFENIFEEPYMTAYFWTMAAMLMYLGYFRRSSASPGGISKADKAIK